MAARHPTNAESPAQHSSGQGGRQLTVRASTSRPTNPARVPAAAQPVMSEMFMRPRCRGRTRDRRTDASSRACRPLSGRHADEGPPGRPDGWVNDKRCPKQGSIGGPPRQSQPPNAWHFACRPFDGRYARRPGGHPTRAGGQPTAPAKHRAATDRRPIPRESTTQRTTRWTTATGNAPNQPAHTTSRTTTAHCALHLPRVSTTRRTTRRASDRGYGRPRAHRLAARDRRSPSTR